jgi:hypothetical protein
MFIFVGVDVGRSGGLSFVCYECIIIKSGMNE